ncbi:hypothetical protein Stsp01_66310 [Streptomyces sp. NBRC 13847]|nr:hypothetical protein Stsp01_66310 [Streptomyces sp. NBRC 13847]
MDSLRGRSRVLDDAAPCTYLGPARAHPRHSRPWQVPPTDFGRACCYKLGEKSCLIHRPRTHLLLKGARKSFSWKDCRDLLVRAHIRLGGPIVVVWDNLNTHLAAGLKRYEAEHDWHHHRPTPALCTRPEPRRAVDHCAQSNDQHRFRHTRRPRHTLRRELRRIQLRPHPIDGCLTATGLTRHTTDPTLETSVAGELSLDTHAPVITHSDGSSALAPR